MTEEPTQTAIITRIITHKLPWEVVDSAGKVVEKPTHRNELETLLILHKDNIKVRIVQTNKEYK